VDGTYFEVERLITNGNGSKTFEALGFKEELIKYHRPSKL
jgi:hypothetical protein